METNNQTPTAPAVGSKDLLSGGRMYLLVGSGESYSAEMVPGDKLLHRMMVAMYGEGEHDPIEVKAWKEHLEDPDNWCHDPDYGPTEYNAAVGETDHIRALLVPVNPVSPMLTKEDWKHIYDTIVMVFERAKQRQ